MQVRKLILPVVFVAFTAFSIWVVGTHGYMAFFDWAVASPVTLQLTLDLVIALSLFVGWMIRDARQRNLTVWPFVVVTVFLGSIGAMLYLLRRRMA